MLCPVALEKVFAAFKSAMLLLKFDSTKEVVLSAAPTVRTFAGAVEVKAPGVAET